MKKISYYSIFLGLFGLSSAAAGFTINITGDDARDGVKVQSETCRQNGEETFTSDAGNTIYTTERYYGGGGALKLTIREGQKGFGALGGIVKFSLCEHVGGRNLVKGDQIWVRTRLLFPPGFEFNRNGRNKFLRLRTFQQGGAVSEGYNDLYIDGTPTGSDYTPFDYIFEGKQQWFMMGNSSSAFKLGEWKTVEYYLRLDDRKESQGGRAKVRVWIDGKLIGETGERENLLTPDSFIESLYFFTYWDNAGAHKTQSFYVDDLVITSDTPSDRDANGYPYIGMGDSMASPVSEDLRPNAPENFTIQPQP